MFIAKVTARLVLAAALLVLAAVILPSESKACLNCVRLDPGSAITYGCTTNDCWGDTTCEPFDHGCYMGAVWCTMHWSSGCDVPPVEDPPVN